MTNRPHQVQSTTRPSLTSLTFPSPPNSARSGEIFATATGNSLVRVTSAAHWTDVRRGSRSAQRWERLRCDCSEAERWCAYHAPSIAISGRLRAAGYNSSPPARTRDGHRTWLSARPQQREGLSGGRDHCRMPQAILRIDLA